MTIQAIETRYAGHRFRSRLPLWNPTTRACAWCLKVARTTDLIQLTDDAWIHRVCP